MSIPICIYLRAFVPSSGPADATVALSISTFAGRKSLKLSVYGVCTKVPTYQYLVSTYDTPAQGYLKLRIAEQMSTVRHQDIEVDYWAGSHFHLPKSGSPGSAYDTSTRIPASSSKGRITLSITCGYGHPPLSFDSDVIDLTGSWVLFGLRSAKE
ncbi:uncharacterized protein RAG0_01343 [Rhynchosporium agropyri]|uniref:Uncharacterized protein n=1 Tax=Rhynchosporium agropyri TaxID=914238 RepID=A0A1E1JWT9_9HELO|nr:uncharacterized protein RAG0_01343 [Rhynchosporium agropyri]